MLWCVEATKMAYMPWVSRQGENLHEQSKYNSHSNIQITHVNIKSEKLLWGLTFAIYSVGKYFQLMKTRILRLHHCYVPVWLDSPFGYWLIVSRGKNCCHPRSLRKKSENISKDLGKGKRAWYSSRVGGATSRVSKHDQKDRVSDLHARWRLLHCLYPSLNNEHRWEMG